MKLIGFSSWKQTSTSIPHSQNDEWVVHKIIGKPTDSSTSSASKRSRTLYKQQKNGKPIVNDQPDLVLTTDHQISILGHTSSKKTLKNSGTDSSDHLVKELPQWIYTSRPGEQSSFLPKQSQQCAKVGAVIDPNSRSVFSLQKDNTVLKVWNLGNEVTGPDEDEDSNMIKRVEFHSPVVSLEAIPFRRHAYVKIKGEDPANAKTNDIQGGVTGVLSNGQIFAILVSSSGKLKVGFYENGDAPSKKTRRRSTSKIAKTNMFDNHLFTVVGYTPVIAVDSALSTNGKKRKAASETSVDNITSFGHITLATLSFDSKNKESIDLCKHVISPDILGDDENELSGSFAKEIYKIELPQQIYIPKGQRAAKNLVHVTQMDQNHVSVLYPTASTSFMVIIVDTRSGDISRPFPLTLKSPDASIVEIGGLSTSILAVITSDDLLSIYDVRRALVLEELKIHETFGEDDNESKCKYGISADCFSGTIGIIRKSAGEAKSDGKVTASFAKIGVFDSETGSDQYDLSANQVSKGSYNLARAIASSMETSTSAIFSDSAPIHQDMSDLFTISLLDTNAETSFVSDAKQLLFRLDKYITKGGQPNGHKETLGMILSDAIKSFDGEDNKWTEHIPQTIIDVLVGASVKFTVSSASTHAQKLDAAEVLMKCIRSGKVSVRNNFDNLCNSSQEILRALLFSLKNVFDKEAASKRDIRISPLNLVYHLLRYCDDSIPELMLTSMIHFILCHVDDEQFTSHWSHFAIKDQWYSDSNIRVLEKRLNTAQHQYDSKKSDELKDLIQSLRNRLAISQKIFFIESIVTHSKCNATLLRAALKQGLTESNCGEVEVLMQTLSKLLRKAGTDRRAAKGGITNPLNASTCISQWLSALVDAHLGPLIQASGDHNGQGGSIEATKKEISAAVSQTRALIGLKQLLDHAKLVLENNVTDSKTKSIDVAPLPLYGIESLIF